MKRDSEDTDGDSEATDRDSEDIDRDSEDMDGDSEDMDGDSEDIDGDLEDMDGCRCKAGFVQDQRQVYARRDGAALILRGLVISPDVPDPNVSTNKELICVLLGFREPYKMRALPDGWELVGDCYVPLFMNGEALACFDWATAYAELPVAPLRDFHIY
ncbi:hypothetical protein LTR37_010698 [Vermiconidia calcicola]|uniref:Uncharacterized protein n=1 Tax=Vermiconidia calcicola TaxID=1690605 RepID=A0ACC3N4I3_9PEZI|nr:hypothetical protein LTR37_010698 [Vermiconidia calcicola]